MLMRKVDGPQLLALGGRPWRVAHVAWTQQRCYVEPADLPARSRVAGCAAPDPYELRQAQRCVLLGATPDVDLSQPAIHALAALSRGVEPPGIEVRHGRGAAGR